MNYNYLKYMNKNKIINYVKYKNDLRQRNITTSSLPPAITFQPSGYCNSNCALCPVGLKMDGGYKKGFMSFDVFDKVIRDMNDSLIKITFADKGEPFLNPEIYHMISHAENNNIMTDVSTNFHVFNESMIKKMLESGLSELTISMHGVSQETYGAYQPGKKIDNIIPKLDILKEYKQKYGYNKIKVSLAFAITKKNQHEIESMKEFSKKYNFNYYMYTASLNLRFYLHKPDLVSQMIDEWAQDDNISDRNNRMKKKNNIINVYDFFKNNSIKNDPENKTVMAKYYCTDPWDSFVVNWDGTISLCCVDYSKYIMGDATRDSIRDIWNSEKYREVRNYLNNPKGPVIRSPCVMCIRY